MGGEEQRDSSWGILGLAADCPDPVLRDSLMLFGQFVGDWDIEECRNLQHDGTWSTEKGFLSWRWILEGRALQDVWGSVDEKTGKVIPWGTTVRFYDPMIHAWRSTWVTPRRGEVAQFIGRKVGEEIHLQLRNQEGHLERWVFFEVSHEFFRWRAETSTDEGVSWVLTEEMRIRRRSR